MLLGIAILILFVTRYQMPFRLDDVLHIEWAQHHTFLDAWHPVRGEIVRSVRPIFAATVWILTHTAGADDYLPWHITLVLSFLIGLAFAGLTSRYISGRKSALYFTTGLYWFAFTPILNVLFWYGDLTYTIELCFITPAWYFGLRALFEKNNTFAILAFITGSLAVMAKEPALVLVHGIWIGALVFRWKELKELWKGEKGKKIFFTILYLLFLGVSFYVLLASPTKSNRFLNSHITNGHTSFFVADRLRYYGDVLLSIPGKLLLVTPLLYLAVIALMRKYRDFQLTRPGRDLLSVLGGLTISAAIAVVFVPNLPTFAVLLLACCIIVAVLTKKERRAALLALPFAICVIAILIALLFTVALVKTQLTELAVTLLVISGWAWSRIFDDLAKAAQPMLNKPRMQLAATLIGLSAILIVVYGFSSRLQKQEVLLKEVQEVRANSNDAIKWMARHLPYDSQIGVAGYRLYGIGSPDDLTSKDDETKLRSQYTFVQGYVRIYLEDLGRKDLHVGYLEDSAFVSRVLDSMRSEGNGYLFLQSDLDLKRFHGQDGKPGLLNTKDTLVQQFAKGPYPAEIWELRPMPKVEQTVVIDTFTPPPSTPAPTAKPKVKTKP